MRYESVTALGCIWRGQAQIVDNVAWAGRLDDRALERAARNKRVSSDVRIELQFQWLQKKRGAGACACFFGGFCLPKFNQSCCSKLSECEKGGSSGAEHELDLDDGTLVAS